MCRYFGGSPAPKASLTFSFTWCAMPLTMVDSSGSAVSLRRRGEHQALGIRSVAAEHESIGRLPIEPAGVLDTAALR